MSNQRAKTTMPRIPSKAPTRVMVASRSSSVCCGDTQAFHHYGRHSLQDPCAKPCEATREWLMAARANVVRLSCGIHPVSALSPTGSGLLPRNNYGFEKRQKELRRQLKKEEKRQRKLDRAKEATETRPDEPESPQAPAEAG